MTCSDVINYGILVILIFATLYYLYSVSYEKKENFEDSINYGLEEVQDIPLVKKRNYKIPVYDEISKYQAGQSFVPHTEECPIDQNLVDTDYYITKYLMGNDNEICELPIKPTKQFNKEFFDFRDKYTYENSSMRQDSVDKVLDLYLEGDMGQARRYPNMKIKDLYDLTTCGQNLYDRDCVRIPYFDNVNFNGYNLSFGPTGLHNTRDTWAYKDEKIMNGGAISKDLYPHDLEANRHMPVLK
jgi:hypothetical protein